MIDNKNAIHPNECTCLSWKPILAGSLVAVGLSFLLNLFGLAIGLTSFTVNNEGVESLALGGLLGTAIGIISSMFAAGWITGYLSQRYCNKRHLGALYGFLMWCLALIIAIFLASYIQQYISFYGHFLSGTTHIILDNVSSEKNLIIETNHLHAANNVIVSAYIIFSLFFLSAFASSLGGHCGMCHVNKNKMTCC